MVGISNQSVPEMGTDVHVFSLFSEGIYPAIKTKIF